MKSKSEFPSMGPAFAFDAMNPAKFMESMQSLQKTWAGFAGSAGLTPTVDVDEIDKRITDLKSVEQWLTLNLTMLQSTIQALQVQRATIQTLNNLGQTVEEGLSQAPDFNDVANAMQGAGIGEAINPAAWWDMLQKQFEQIAATAIASYPPPAPPAPGAAKMPTVKKTAGTTSKFESKTEPKTKPKTTLKSKPKNKAITRPRSKPRRSK